MTELRAQGPGFSRRKSRTDPFIVMAKPVGPTCNLHCRYCYYLGKTALFPDHQEFIMGNGALDAYIAKFIQASPGPIVHFVWHGGEPTLAGIGFYERALELQRKYSPPGFNCINNLQTNGVLLDKYWCRFLSENNFHVGISIDGPSRLHDKYRVSQGGSPSHARVMLGYNNLRESGIDPDVLCTINSFNSQFPEETYRFFLRNEVAWLQFIPIVVRLANNRVSKQSVSPDAYANFLIAIFDEWVRYDMTSIAIQLFLECLRVWSGSPADLCIMAQDCGQVLAMEHDGSIYSCDHFVDLEHRLGTIDSNSLADLIDSRVQIEFGKAKTSSLTSYCQACPVLFACNGGCPKDRFSSAIDGEAGLNYLCSGYRAFYQHISPYMNKMVELSLLGQKPSRLMADLRAVEANERARWKSANRNAPCPCESGLKFKNCCLAKRREAT